jgi:glycosyltransferase involved in cell wall biosynthesis
MGRAIRDRARLTPDDTVIVTSLKGALAMVPHLRRPRRQLVWWLQDRLSRDYLGAAATHAARILLYALPRAVVFNSETTRATARTRRSTPTYVAFPPVSDDFFNTAARREEGSDQAARLVIGMSGRLAPWKGQHLLLEAVAALPAGDFVVEFVGGPLFGEDAYAERLHDLATEWGLDCRVRFLGHRPDPSTHVATWDIAVHASTLPEPFGMVIAEAMAAGCAVIAPDVGGPRELIEHDVTGWLFRPGDPTSLANGLDALISDPDRRHRLARAGATAVRRLSIARLTPGLRGWLAENISGTSTDCR